MNILQTIILFASAALSSDPPTSIDPSTRIMDTWVSVRSEMNGGVFGKDTPTYIKFDGDQVSVNAGAPAPYTIDFTEIPATIDIGTPPTMHGILQFTEGKLHICLARDKRPTKFRSQEGDNCVYHVLVESKKKAP